jgi:ZIP family zinc transporter
VAAALGNVLFIGFSEQIIAATMALAAGAILAMLIDTMIPEAFEIARNYAGMIAVVGFLAAFYLSKISG